MPKGVYKRIKMSKRIIKLEIGKKYGRLTVIRMNEQRAKSGHMLWLCCCDCGNEKYETSSSLIRGNTKSCGCLKKERNFKHGDSRTRLHRIWTYMRSRCRNPNNTKFHCYGGRGIKVCLEWQEYIPFKKWAKANGYKDNLVIDRIERSGNYEPNNCQWITAQENNKKIYIDYFKEGYAVGYLSALHSLRR